MLSPKIHRLFSLSIQKQIPSIFLDYQSTTPVDARVLNKMLPFLQSKFGNAHSTSHQFGWDAADAIKKARSNISQLIKCDPSEIVFTSGATEANNLAIKGWAAFHSTKKHIITTQIEHKCILNTCRYLESKKGYTITYLPVNHKGWLNLQHIHDNITRNTWWLSLIHVHNEIGVVQDLKGIGKICKENKIYFHTDSAQGFGKVPINVNEFHIDLMSISGHKIYGPKGIGAWYVRKRPRVRIEPLFHGGGQERGLRSGTLPVHWVVGFGEAARIADEEMKCDYTRIKEWSQRLWNKLKTCWTDIYLNGDETQRYPGNLNISFAFVEGESWMMAIKNIAVSSGSACTSESLEPSYVLNALGVKDDLSHTSLRIGIGRFTTKEEIDITADAIINAVNKWRSLSPLWEMKQEGIDISKIEWAKH